MNVRGYRALILMPLKRHKPPEKPSDAKVVVLGGGPAGSSAALALALHGVRPTIVDKRQLIGSPVQCGEGFTPIMGEMSLVPIRPDLVRWRTGGTSFI